MTFCLVKIISERHHKTIIRSDSYLIIIVVSILIGLIAIVVFISLVWFACKENQLLILLQSFLCLLVRNRDNWIGGKRGIGGSPRSN